ncbi:hypothetical protein A8B79_15675 [Balneola sp. EhC07]|uniref:tail fiber protein n=1 Tax=Balneola sp. EhC07 TaxID=1849360 RepID=UPI0007F478B8|nr:tail fiber protein [Balneola sp. EhC07]OAN63252.1 hypothetical protein A8B79_15675 [Balneola sp. EhC07]
MKKVYGLLVLGIALSFSLSVKAQFTTSGNDIYYNSGNVGIGISAPVQKLDIAGSIKIHYPGKVYFDRVNVKSEQFLATNGQGGGWMFNATYDGSGNPQSNATYSIEPGQHNTSAGYLDFDGNSRNWSINLSAPSTGIGQPVAFKKVAFFDNTEVTLSPTGNTTDFHLKDNGYLGIGTADPLEKLHISSGTSGDAVLILESDTDNNNEGDNPRIEMLQDGGASGAYIGFDQSWGGNWQSDNLFRIGLRYDGNDITNAFTIKTQNGNVGIGTTNPDQKLTVKGKIHSEEVIVDLSVPGPDYVFEEDYDLTTLKELEAYIKANKHLPEVPSAKEMEANGITLGEMNMLLLKKIEELTLHLIEQNEMNKKQEEKLQSHEEHISRLIKRVEQLETRKENH